LSRLAGTHVGADCATAMAVRPANPIPRASNGPRMRARKEIMDSEQHRRVDRRTFIKGGVVAGGVIAGAGLGIRALADTGSSRPKAAPAAPGPGRASRHHHRSAKPNILVIMVDQLRFPQWFSATPIGMSLPPNIQRLREQSVSLARHYTASNDCTPSRSAMLTGLYTHQTGCMITGGSTLDPGFPTYGTMLREHGYHTRWLGKWHLTHGDNHWSAPAGEAALERYGFAGGIYPSPDGAPGQGFKIDPHVVTGFADWFREEGGAEPWCTTVSFVNPHDIAWWYVWSDRVAAEASARPTVRRLPPNYETPELLDERRKPRLQRSLQETAAASFGPVPFEGPEALPIWLSFLDLYAKLQRSVDRHIGSVLKTLESQPEIAANTVVVFTSDHGEYGASHGLRGKGAAAYEESTRVPLLVKDPRGVLTSALRTPRTQLSSSVDLAPLLLTIGAGGNTWRPSSRTLPRPDAPTSSMRPTRWSRSSPSKPIRPPRRCTSSRCEHRRPSTPPTRTGPKKASSRSRRAAKPSSTTTAAMPGGSSSTTAPITARSSRGCSKCTNMRSGTSCGRGCRSDSSRPTGAASPTTSRPPGRPPRGPRRRASGAPNGRSGNSPATKARRRPASLSPRPSRGASGHATTGPERRTAATVRL